MQYEVLSDEKMFEFIKRIKISNKMALTRILVFYDKLEILEKCFKLFKNEDLDNLFIESFNYSIQINKFKTVFKLLKQIDLVNEHTFEIISFLITQFHKYSETPFWEKGLGIPFMEEKIFIASYLRKNFNT